MRDCNVIDSWVDDFEKVSANALAQDWFVSPLEYHWPDAKKMCDQMFRAGAGPSPVFDEHVSSALYQMSMNSDLRAKMMVYAFMRHEISSLLELRLKTTC
jgi:hypothetical protein